MSEAVETIEVILEGDPLADSDELEAAVGDPLTSEDDPSGDVAAESSQLDPDFKVDEMGEDTAADVDEAEGGEQGLHVTVQQEGTKDYYFQKYKKEWEELPEFREWLQPVGDDLYKAECIVCNTYLRCHKLKLRQHAKSKKHHLNMVARAGGRTPQQRRRPGTVVTPRRERRSFGRRMGAPTGGRGRGQTLRHHTADQEQRQQGRAAAPQDVSYGDLGRVTYSIGLGGNKVGFIGAGSIAQAIAQAILDKGVIHSGRLTASAPPSSRHLSVWSSWGCTVTNCNDVVMQSCNVVFLCVPPDAALAALHTLTPDPDCAERCFISVVPGLSRQHIETILASKFVPSIYKPSVVQSMGSMYVIRCMVNLAVRTGAGCCAYSVPASLPDRWLLCLEVICGAMGVSQPLDDDRLDTFAAAFSPGPAIALVFAEALTLGAASVGLPWHIARKMAAQTLMGTGQLLLDADHPTSLHDQAAPPGGSNLAALVALQNTDMKSGVAAAVQACLRTMRAEFGE